MVAILLLTCTEWHSTCRLYPPSLYACVCHTFTPGWCNLCTWYRQGTSALEEFYKLTPQLYPQAVCTMNFHGLIHLSKFVRTWGPLWSYSCFGFESMNGYLRKHCHGTRNVLPQLIHNIRMQQMLPINGKTLIASASSSARTFIESLLETATKTQCITELKGRVTHKWKGRQCLVFGSVHWLSSTTTYPPSL